MWVLIIIMASAGGVNATTAEFTTQTKCQAAGQWAISAVSSQDTYQCFEK